MKMNGQSRTFVKQVKLDLLALSDADIFQIIQQWIQGSNLSEQPFDNAEKIWLALGYTRKLSDFEAFSQPNTNIPGTEVEEPFSWIAPEPQHLRTLLAAMDEQQFAQYVITIAFQALHPIYPEWYDGLTFNAHLANYLRLINTKRRTVTSKQNK
jgi:predicted phosphoadenosine phosphosulfate sulfurtransferase